MRTQRATTLTDDSATAEAQARPALRAVQVTRSRRMIRALAVATATLVAAGGYVHYCLYRHGYRAIPTIGVAFLLQVVTSAVVVLALLVGPHFVGRVAHVTDRMAGTLTRLAAAALATGTLVAFALTRTPGGLFNFQERGLQPAPQASIALLAELGVLVTVGASLLADRVVQRWVRTAVIARV